MKNLFLRATCVIALLSFGFIPTANATGPGGGGGSCGYIKEYQLCDGPDQTMRIRCKTIQGGLTTECTLVNCDGTTIELNEPPNHCD